MAGKRGAILAATFAALCAAVSAAPAQAAGESGQPKAPAAAPLEAQALASDIVGVIGDLDPRAGSSAIEAALHRRLLRAARSGGGAQEAARPVIADALGLVLSHELTLAQRQAVFDLFRVYAGSDPAPARIEAAATSPSPTLLLETLGPPPSIHGAGGSDYTAH